MNRTLLFSKKNNVNINGIFPLYMSDIYSFTSKISIWIYHKDNKEKPIMRLFFAQAYLPCYLCIPGM